MRLHVLLVLLCQLLLLSCKKYKPADAAFFIKAGKVSLATNSNTQGTGAHKITDFWLYVNGQFQGVYAVGSLMPIVPKDNRARISIFAGIKNNGIAATRINWLFYERYDLDTTVSSTGGTITRDFTFKYNSSTVFAWAENFDSEGFKIINSPDYPAKFTTVSQGENFEGRSLVISTATAETIAQVESSGSYTLPAGTSNVYLELNYKCNSEFSIGLMGSDNIRRPVIFINPQDTWTKIYVLLADAVNQTPVYSTYKVYFRLPKKDDVAEAKMFLDNIKLVYLPSL